MAYSSNQKPRTPLWFGVGFLFAGICFHLIRVSSAFSQSFSQSVYPGDIKPGTPITALATYEILDYKTNGVTQTTTNAVSDLTLAVTAEYGFSSLYNSNQAVTPGDVSESYYGVTNEGNADDPNYTIERYYTLEAGAANWTVEVYVGGSFSETLEAGVITSESVAIDEDDDYLYHYKVIVPTSTTEAPNLSKLTIWNTVETTSDPTPAVGGEYYGANKYEYGGYDKLTDTPEFTVSVPILTLSRTSYVDAPDEYETNAGSGHENDPVPGAVITFTMTYSNEGNASAQDVILIDKIPTGETYATNLAHVNVGSNDDRGTVTISPPTGNEIGWTIYYTTDDPPLTTNYGEYTGWTLVGTLSVGDEDFPDTGLFTHGSPTFEARWIKWEKATVITNEDNKTLVWGVTIR
jgi:uncharacterized repeat protein (TIGR01451 family)